MPNNGILGLLDDASDMTLRRGERRKQHTRRRLIDAAAETYALVGVESATISAITERADVGLGTFYLHFEDKDSIALAVTTIVVTRIMRDEEHALETVRSVGGEPDPLSVFSRVLCAQAAEAPGLMSALLTWKGPRPAKEGADAVIRSESAMQEAFLPHLARRYEDGVAGGRYRIEDSELAARACFGVYTECIPSWAASGKTDWEALSAFVQRTVVGMFRI